MSSRRLRLRLEAGSLTGSGPKGHSVRLHFKVIVPHAAGRAVVLAVGAGDDGGRVQKPVPAGVIRLR